MTLLQNPTLLILDAPATAGTPELEILAKGGTQARILEYDPAGGLSAANREALAQADFILTGRTDVDEAMLEEARRCLLVAHYGPGVGPGVGRVAMEAARRQGIYVASVPDYAAGDWTGETFRLIEQLMAERGARSLKKLRLGIVGLGCVGKRVAREGTRRGMHVWAYDPFVSDEMLALDGVRRADLETLMGIADVVTLHVPLGPATRGMLSAERLGLMKRDAILVNTAAPELVDLDGLAAVMERGRPAAAGFDEDLAGLLGAGHPLAGWANVIHGPRRAGRNPESAEACRRKVGELLADVLRGNRPGHLLIDPPCPRHILLLAGQSWA